MTTPPLRRPADAIRALDLIQQMADDMRRMAHPIHRALVDSQPGYPTATMGGGGSGGDISDPTARYALEADDSAADLALWYQDLDYAAKWLTEAWYLTTKHMAAMSTQKRCGNPNGCPRHRLAESGYGGFCQPCYRELRRSAAPEDQAAA